MIQIYKVGTDSREILQKLQRRSENNSEVALEAVKDIIAAVKQRGDAALFEYSKKFDSVELTKENIKVSEMEFEQAYKSVAPELLDTLRHSAVNIRAFHERQKRNTWVDIGEGSMVGQMTCPIQRAGVYVPGGRAAYPSSVLMNIIPAKVAGVSKIIMVTPAVKGKITPLTLVAAKEAGADEVYKVGGAQAIAALAYGTDSIPKVDKITGPGNIYVALAKREVFGEVGIDTIAGPSEVLVIADCYANPGFVAADMLSQAEHDPLAAALLVTDSEELGEKVKKEINRQLDLLSRRSIAYAAIIGQGGIIIVKDLNEALDFANELAPEHLELMVRDPLSVLKKVKNAGAVFLGANSPEPLGDYFAGPNHILPTGGAARFSSALSVDDFVKRMSIINYSFEALERAAGDIMRFADVEGLDAHAKAIKIRLDNAEK